MNKRHLILVLIVFGTLRTPIHAQSSDQKFHFGLKVSPTLAWLKPDTKGIEKGGSKLGFSYGIITEFNIQDNYSIATGLQVTYRGGKLILPKRTPIDGIVITDINGNVIKIKTTYNLQYIELPITLKMKTNAFDKYKFFGQFGIVNGLNIRAKDGDNNNIKNSINSYNVAMSIALGSEYTLSGSTALVASLEFNNGFIDVLKGDDKAISNYLGLNIGVLF